jgi:hypothetical protein
MDIHTGMTGIDQASLEAAHKADAEIEESESVRFLHSWADPKSGKVFCLSEGPNMEAVMRVLDSAGHPTDEIYEVPFEGE